MSWRDRDYARGESPFRSFNARGRRSWLIRGSIVTTLIVVNVVVFLLGGIDPSLGKAFYVYGAMQGDAVLHGQLWRLVTAQYLHGGVSHIFFNMFTLHFLGRPLEGRWSPKKFFAVYTVAGLVGNVFFTVLAARGVIDRFVPAVGASGSINGLIGIVAVMFPAATVYIYFLFPMSMRTCALILGAISLFSIITRGANYGGEACHLAGLVFGAWWAWKGDRWWEESRWRLPRVRAARPFGGRPVAAGAPDPHSSAGAYTPWRSPRAPVEDSELDRILKKVFEGGIHTLSDAEKMALQSATEQQKQAAHWRRSNG